LLAGACCVQDEYSNVDVEFTRDPYYWYSKIKGKVPIIVKTRAIEQFYRLKQLVMRLALLSLTLTMIALSAKSCLGFLMRGTSSKSASRRMMSSPSSSTSPPTVLVPIADGSEEIETTTIIDILVRAGCAVTVARAGDGATSKSVVCSRFVKITADKYIKECEHETYDLIALPGGMPGAEHLRDCSVLDALLKKQHDKSALIAAICAAPAVVLSSKGLLKKATCYPAAKFKVMIPDFSSAAVVVDKNIISSQGPATAMAFALKLVEVLCGKSKADSVAQELLYEGGH
jgi:protein deglycase